MTTGPAPTNVLRKLVFNKSTNARRLGIYFDLRPEDVKWPTHCPALGIPLDYSVGTKGGVCKDNSPTFDRMNPRIGYTAGNTRVISNRANRIKTNANVHEIVAVARWIERVAGET